MKLSTVILEKCKINLSFLVDEILNIYAIMNTDCNKELRNNTVISRADNQHRFLKIRNKNVSFSDFLIIL